MLWLYDLPTSAMVTLFSVIFVGFTWLGAIFIRPFLRLLLRSQPGINDIVGYVLSSHCVFFGLLLGLLAVGTYQNMSDIDKVIVREAGMLRAFYRSMQSYPEPLRSETLPLIKEYVRYVIEDSWPLQRRGITDGGGVPRMNAVQNKLFSFEPNTKAQEILHDKTVEQFNQMAEVRRQRIQSASTGISPIMWLRRRHRLAHHDRDGLAVREQVDGPVHSRRGACILPRQRGFADRRDGPPVQRRRQHRARRLPGDP